MRLTMREYQRENNKNNNPDDNWQWEEAKQMVGDQKEDSLSLSLPLPLPLFFDEYVYVPLYVRMTWK